MSDSESAAPVCEEKARLHRRCAVTESNHQLAMQQLSWMIGALKKPNYEDLSEFAETSRRIMDDAREALERLTAQHGC